MNGVGTSVDDSMNILSRKPPGAKAEVLRVLDDIFMHFY